MTPKDHDPTRADEEAKCTRRVDSLRALVQDAMEDYTHQAMRAVENRLNVLSFIGSSAPLFGMTGTVTGMIKSFNVLSMQGTGNPAGLAAGIAEALITTAAGLIIAIPSLIAYNWLVSQVNQVVVNIEVFCSSLIDRLAGSSGGLKSRPWSRF